MVITEERDAHGVAHGLISPRKGQQSGLPLDTE
jgi:hypothetical protein